MDYYIEVISFDSGMVEKQLGPYTSERMADKAMSGVDRNLNHELFYSQVIPEDDICFEPQSTKV